MADGLALAELLEGREHRDDAGDARLQYRQAARVCRLLDRIHRSVPRQVRNARGVTRRLIIDDGWELLGVNANYFLRGENFLSK